MFNNLFWFLVSSSSRELHNQNLRGLKLETDISDLKFLVIAVFDMHLLQEVQIHVEVSWFYVAFVFLFIKWVLNFEDWRWKRVVSAIE